MGAAGGRRERPPANQEVEPLPFAVNLRRFNNDILNQMTAVHGQLVGLGQTWRDKEHEKFRQEFEATMLVIKRFMEASTLHIPFLVRKAERVEEYLQQR